MNCSTIIRVIERLDKLQKKARMDAEQAFAENGWVTPRSTELGGIETGVRLAIVEVLSMWREEH